MVGYLCCLLPGIVFCYAYEKHNRFGRKSHTRIEVLRLLAEYAVAFAGINGVLIGIWCVKGNHGNIIEALNNYSDFAAKYAITAVLTAFISSYLIGYLKNRVKFSVSLSFDGFLVSRGAKTAFLVGYAGLLSFLHFSRCFDNSFWGDEGITIKAARLSWNEMLHYVARNGHSPFQYSFEWLCCRSLGESGFIIHFASALPYFLIMLISVTLIRKWFGNKAAFVLMTLCTFLNCAVTYNLEVRMYAWCEFFILMAFLMDYGIFATNKIVYYILMGFFSLGAVYSHYFALASIGILYLVLLVYKVVKQNVFDIFKVIISGGTVLLLLLPWIFFAKGTTGGIISNYGLGTVTWKSCFEYIFSSKYSWGLFICFWISSLLVFCYETKIIKAEREDSGQLNVTLRLFPKAESKLEGKWFWMISGICAVFGTIIFSQVFSTLVFPITLLRYLYVSFVIVWFIFSINVSRLKNNKFFAVVIVAFIISSCWQNYYQTYTIEKNNNNRLKSTLNATAEIGEDDFIYTDIVHFAWTICDVYYPITSHDLFGHAEWWGPDEIPVLDDSYSYWLFLSDIISEDVQDNLYKQGKKVEMVVDHGFIGTGNVYIYKIIDL